MNDKRRMRWGTFVPPFLVLFAFVIISIVDQEVFLAFIDGVNDWIISNLGWAASILALVIVIAAAVAAFSKFGDVRIGGADAKPRLSNLSWFTIALTTTMAAGILFWGPGEPIVHYSQPPTEIYGIEGMTNAAEKFSMETMFLHWTIVPYCMYAVPAIVFGFMYYNAKKPYSIASEISPALGDRVYKPRWMRVIDAVTLFAIGAGMAGSVAQAFMNISGGVAKLTGLPSDERMWLVVAIVLGVSVVATAVSGIQRAMKVAANVNVVGFALFLLFLLLFSNAPYLLNLSTEALGGFAGTFIERILVTGASADSQWPQWWTTFYWFSWMAWAPTSGAFLGQIAYGRKVKHALALYVGLCAAVSAFWMMLVSGTALWVETGGLADLVAAYSLGVENVPYEMLSALPFGFVVIPLFVVLIYLSTVTACNSNCIAMAGISSVGMDTRGAEPPTILKVVWGVIPMAVGFVMIAAVGVDGVKIIANFGGMFAALIMVACAASLIVLVRKYEEFDKTVEGKGEAGVSDKPKGDKESLPATDPLKVKKDELSRTQLGEEARGVEAR